MLDKTTNPAAYEFASASLLSRQPIRPRKVNEKEEQKDWTTLFNHLESRRNALYMWRYSWWAFWAVLAAYFLPFRYVWLVVSNKMWRGHNLNNQIINSHGLLAVRTCASGMWTGLCSPSRPWFKMGIGIPWITIDEEGKNWLKDTEDKIYTVLAQSNFYSTMAQGFKDLTVFATAPVIIYEDFEDVVRFYLPAAGEYFLANGARMTVDTLYREYTMTVAQIVGWATLENCPKLIQDLWAQGNYDTEYVVAHAIEPNFDIPKKGTMKDKVQIVPPVFNFREVYWLRHTKTERPLSKRGFTGIPFMTLRWASVQNDAYGRDSPCMNAIGDNKQLQLEDGRKAEFIEKGVRPPMGADVELKNEPASIMPGMTTYMSTSGGQFKKYWPLFEVVPTWLTALTADISKVEARVDHCLYVDIFMAISRMEGVQPRNELELTKRDLERLQELGPVITLAEKEFDIAIGRVMDILERRRMLEPRPQSLMNVPLKITYVSILRLAQRSAESVAMKDGFTTMGELSSAAKAGGVPDPIRTINLDKALQHYLELNNFPPDCIYTKDEVAAHDKIRAQEQQKAEAPEHAAAAVNAAKTLSETQVPGGNALGALMGQAPGGMGAGLQ